MWVSGLYFSWWLQPGTVHSLEAGGLNRSYVVHVPDGRETETPRPVVLALHGATMNGPMMAWFSDLNRKADQAGFITVYPNGTGRRSSYTWNGGSCCGSAARDKVDDVAFINALLDKLIESYPVDVDRIYVTGMSNGAIMAYRLAAELSDRIAAIAPVAGTIATDAQIPRRSVPVLHIHGTADEYVPFQGGRGPKSLTRVEFKSVDHSIQTWVRLNGCDPDPAIDVLSRTGDELVVARKTFGNGRDGAEVVLVTVEGGGHTWPGKASPASALGKSATNVSANELIWDFFQRHPMKHKA